MTAPDGTRTEHRYGVIADGGTILAWHDVLDPNRHRLQTRSDALGRQVQVLEISGDCGSWGYTCSGPYTTPWTTGTTTHYRYDALDRLTTVTRGSLVTTIGYDAAGRKTQLQDPDMGPWTYAYDGAGHLARQTDTRGQRTCFYYDALHRLTGKHYRPDDACPTTPSDPQLAIRYSYDASDGTTQFGKGRRTGMVDRSGATTWTYDQRGRVTKEEKTITGAGTFRTQWGYRADDRAYKMQFPGGPTGSIGEQVDFSYRPQQLVNRVSTTSQVYVASSSYDAAGRLVGRALGADLGVVQTTVSYYPWTTPNGQGRLQRLTAVKSADATTLQDLRYSTTSTGAVGYDAVGNLLRIEDWKAGSPQVHRYSYDDRDRLLSASVTGGIGGTYSETDAYDPVTGTLSSKAGVTYSYTDPAHRHAVTHRGSTLSTTPTALPSDE